MNGFVKTHLIAAFTALLVLGCAQSKMNSLGNNTASKNSENIEGRRAEVLFLGNTSKHHDSGKYAPWLAIKLFESGINTSYTVDLNDLNPENLAKYDALIIYANHDVISPAQESALKDFVQSGKGLVPLHSASGCFLNSEWYIKAIGGQFASHKTGDFPAVIAKPNHPVMKGIKPFTTWDETYVLKNINPDMTVLTEREEDGKNIPYTWVRNEGKGRVFYTAYGHEDRTWSNIGFLDLIRNGVMWALGDQVQSQIASLNIPDVDIYNSDTIAAYTKRHIVPKMQEALTASESQKLTQVLPDFKVELFASDPDIINPIAMAWDERGRLWVVESVDYPNTFKETDGEANDRIKICEDTDGDGKADKFTVFADGLNIPTSIILANDGAIVTMAPDILFMKDTNGDDKVDVTKVLSHGWGKGDTHSGPSNLIYGFDNKIWGTVGYSGFNGTVNGQKMRFPMGIFRFPIEGSELSYLGKSSNNTWGLGVTEDN
ncbi:PVC-type heme-binding CxxCH protein, partial [Persicitalea sp.]|uniref:PVC-type heme-binding CxxCH protein n=1 Tax=Persicitalea sp. TaxID=3100273 RepID=UPI003593753E